MNELITSALVQSYLYLYKNTGTCTCAWTCMLVLLLVFVKLYLYSFIILILIIIIIIIKSFIKKEAAHRNIFGKVKVVLSSTVQQAMCELVNIHQIRK